MTDSKNSKEYENLTFEESLRAVEEIVDELDSGSRDLDKAVEA